MSMAGRGRADSFLTIPFGTHLRPSLEPMARRAIGSVILGLMQSATRDGIFIYVMRVRLRAERARRECKDHQVMDQDDLA